METIYEVIAILIMIAGFVFAILAIKKMAEKRKKMDKILSVISYSETTPLSTVVKNTGFSQNEVVTLIDEIIKAANGKDERYKLLKNARIDYAKGEVVLDLHANDSVLAKIGNSVNSVLDRFAPKKEIKKDWTCRFCGALNKGGDYTCVSCGAGRIET